MSYDIDLVIDTGAEEPATVCEVGNMTSNVSPMWGKALGHNLSDLDGRVAGGCVAALARAVSHMQDPANKAAYEAMNPLNGWGDRVGATRYLEDLLRACQKHPKATISICR